MPTSEARQAYGSLLLPEDTQGVLVIDTGEDDDLGFGIKPEKQAESSPHLGSPQVPECGAHRVALPVLFAVEGHLARFQHQLCHLQRV
jgi:hypothetical protein